MSEVKTPKHRDNAMVVIDIKAWIALLTLLLVLIAVVVWAFFGTMQMTVNASGALVRAGKIVEIYASESARVNDIAVSRYQDVEKDQVIARMDQTALVNELNSLIENGGTEAEIDAARKTLLARSQVITLEDGRVQDIYFRSGDYVEKGERIATILQEPAETQTLECLLYVPLEKVGKIVKGMKVNVFPAFADKNEYGSMIGTVQSISLYPVTVRHLFETVGNEELAASFAEKAVYEVVVSLLASETTATGYEWTISQGPSGKIGDLSLCDAIILQKEVRPIDVFFFNKY